jgi:hypothetical protein
LEKKEALLGMWRNGMARFCITDFGVWIQLQIYRRQPDVGNEKAGMKLGHILVNIRKMGWDC